MHLAGFYLNTPSLLKKPKPWIYAEFGIRNGDTFNLVAPLFEKAYAVDHVDCLTPIQHNANLIWFHGSTTEFINNLSDEKFDLVFIDADHSYEQSMKDFAGVFPFVKDNGIIVLHDSYPPNEAHTGEGSACGDVWKTAWEIRTQWKNVCEIVTIPAEFGFSIIRKAEGQLLWR